MSEEALGRLILSVRTLIDASGGGDPHAMEAATKRFGEAVDEVRAARGWREFPGIATRALHALNLAEQARVHINYQADRNQRRLQALAVASGANRGNAYNRYGRLG